MKVKSNVKAGGIKINHNEKIESCKKSKGFIVRTGVKAGDDPGGGGGVNHNEKIERARKAKNLTVKTGIKAGGIIILD